MPKTKHDGDLARLLTLTEARVRLGVGETKIKELVETKAVRAFKVAGRWRIPLSAILDYIDERMRAAS